MVFVLLNDKSNKLDYPISHTITPTIPQIALDGRWDL